MMGDEELTLIEGQIEGLLEGDGASEDHEDVLAFLKNAGLKPAIADRVHRAIVNAEKPDGERPSKPGFQSHAPRFYPTTSIGILGRAQTLQEQRAKDYDEPGGERSMEATVQAFNIITRRNLTESEGWLIMQILKDVRDRKTTLAHRDSLEDCVSYAALKAEARLKEF